MSVKKAFGGNGPDKARNDNDLGRESFTLDVPIQGGGSKSVYGYGYLYALLEDRDIYLRRISATSGAALGSAAIASIINAHDDYDTGRHAAMRQLVKLKDTTARNGDIMIQFLRNCAELRGIDWASDDPNIPPLMIDELEKYVQWRNTFRDSFNTANDLRQLCMMNYIMFPPMAICEMWTQILTAPVSNTLNYDPVANIIDNSIPDIATINNARHIQLSVNATNTNDPDNMYNVNFGPGRITRDVLRASANLRELGNTVTIDGQPYIDGGYQANPAFDPVFNAEDRTTTLMIATNEMPAAITPGKQSAFKKDMALYDAMHEEAINEFIHHAQNGEDCHLVVMPPDLGMDHTAILNPEQWWLDKLFNLGYEQAKADLPDLKANFGRRSTYHWHMPGHNQGAPTLKMAN